MSAQTISSTPTAPWGATVTARPARVADLPALAQLLVRCSPATRLGWYGRGGSVLPLAQQEAWLALPGGLVVEQRPGRLVAVAALRPATCTGEDDTITSTAEVLVDDAWQGRGLGTSLVHHLARTSVSLGRTELQVPTTVDLEAADRILGALGARLGARPRQQRHDHGRCPRVHLSARALAALRQPERGAAGAVAMTVRAAPRRAAR